MRKACDHPPGHGCPHCTTYQSAGPPPTAPPGAAPPDEHERALRHAADIIQALLGLGAASGLCSAHQFSEDPTCRTCYGDRATLPAVPGTNPLQQVADVMERTARKAIEVGAQLEARKRGAVPGTSDLEARALVVAQKLWERGLDGDGDLSLAGHVAAMQRTLIAVAREYAAEALAAYEQATAHTVSTLVDSLKESRALLTEAREELAELRPGDAFAAEQMEAMYVGHAKTVAELREAVSRIQQDLVSSACKQDDAPASSAEHFDRAMETLKAILARLSHGSAPTHLSICSIHKGGKCGCGAKEGT